MPSITAWTRLESQPFRGGVDEGLAARVYDPLWLLARQWQVGEFVAEDSGTPVSVRVRLERLALSRYLAAPMPDDGHVEGRRYDPRALPLEALVEQEAVRAAPDPRVAAEAGLHFLALLSHHGVPDLRAAYLAAYPLERPPPDDALDPAGSRSLAVFAGRAPDGRRLHADLVAAGDGLPPQPEIADAQRDRVLAAARAFVAWYDGLFAEPAERVEPWVTERLEYAFAVSARTDGPLPELTLVASEYPGGRLDWDDFDVRPGDTLGAQPDDPTPETVTRTVVPSPVRYRGMPADRWWEFEDAEVDFGRVDAALDELLRLALVEFALTYGNDWFVVPVELEPGAVYGLRSLVVTDAFGERTLVPHYSAVDVQPSGFRLFAISRADPNLLFLPPVVASTLSGPPIEEVLFLRDELANLAWAVEKVVPGPNGLPLDRYEAHVRRRPASAPPADGVDEPPVYRLASTVPDYWVPLLPVRPSPGDPSIRLRRGRVLVDRGGEPVLPPVLGRVLAPERPLELFEEEVPRAGARVTRAFQQARWLDGTTHLWLGRRKSPGRGEGSSGLRFDVVE